MTICGMSTEAFLKKIEAFHGWKAPGVILGGFMVDWAKEQMDPSVEADAIVETRHCLPDAVQLLTPCTIGNGWLKILDWDKYALSLYDRRELTGVRVWVDAKKTVDFPDLYDWIMKLKPKRELPLETITRSILSAGRSHLSSRRIRVIDHYKRVKKSTIRVCPRCGEAFSSDREPLCFPCREHSYCESFVQR